MARTVMYDFPEYVVIDTETTGLDTDARIIDLAAIRVRQGKIVDTFHSLVNPDMPLPDLIMRLTGISDEDLAYAPFFHEIIPDFLNFCGQSPIVGHNVSFDLCHLAICCEKCGVAFRLREAADTLDMARYIFPWARSHKLCNVASLCGFCPENAHQALDDVMTTMRCFEIMNTMQPMPRPEQYAANISPRIRSCYLENICCDLGGKTFCLTGDLTSMSRPQAIEVITTHGGIYKSNVSKKVHYLIRAEEYDEDAIDGISTKTRKAYELQAQGHPLQIINEQEFLELLGLER